MRILETGKKLALYLIVPVAALGTGNWLLSAAGSPVDRSSEVGAPAGAIDEPQTYGTASDKIASVNGEAIPAYYVDMVAQGQEDTPEARAKILDDMITRTVVAQEAVRRGLDRQFFAKSQIEFSRQYILQEVLRAELAAAHPISEAEVKGEYERYVASATNDREYYVWQLFAETEQEANAAIARLKNGEAFADLLMETVSNGSPPRGGELGWISPPQLAEPIAAAVAGLGAGEIAEPPIQSPYGFLVVKVENVRARKVPTMKDMEPRLVDTLNSDRFQAFVDQLRSKAEVRKH